MASFGHIILYGFINFWRQVFLLCYKNTTRLIRTPWTLIFMVMFPSLMLGIWFGLSNTITHKMSESDSAKEMPIHKFQKCESKVYPRAKPCMTIAFFNATQDLFDSLRLVAKTHELTMATSITDYGLDYDVAHFPNETMIEAYNYYQEDQVVWYVVRGGGKEYGTQGGPGSLVYAVSGPNDYDMGGFGFRSDQDNPWTETTGQLIDLIADAYLGVAQAKGLGRPGSDALMPDIQINRVAVKVDSPSSSSGSSSTDNSDSAFIWWIGGSAIIWISLFASQIWMSNQILEDRRKKLRLGMVMMGLNTGAYQVSWLVFHIAISAIYSTIVLGIGYACKYPFFLQTNLFVIWLFYWLSSCALISFTLLTSAIVHHPAGHTTLMVFLFLVGGALFVLSSIDTEATGNQGSSLFFSFWNFQGASKLWNFNLAFSMGNIVRCINHKIYIEGGGSIPPNSFVWNDIYNHTVVRKQTNWSSEDPIYEYFVISSVSQSFGALICCTFLALIASIYLEIVFPREIGNPQGFFFFGLPSYWGLENHSELNVETVAHRAEKMSDVAVDLNPEIMGEYNQVMNRTASGDPTLAVAITKICKSFQKGRKPSAQDTRAVDSVTLGADASTVLGIVGHNGAGKTTLMSMLCGVVLPSTGDARIFGHSITKNMTAIHNVMGVCPQEDVLWPELTPEEHLKLFAMLKKIPFKDHARVISESLDEVGLLHVRTRIVNKLSGGMKRRLSVAIALLGNTKIIMLDEPTAGLDPRNRLEVWSIVERIKVNRVVLLTTHSMVEAATLSDKVAVMAVGRLRAVGSPTHLIHKYGKGHQLSVVSRVAKADQVKALMAEIVPDALLEVDTGASLTYSLPSSKSRQLPDFCRYMETHGEDSDLIEDWGISQTTLEQVFLKLTHGGGNQEGLNNSDALQLNVSVEGSEDVLGFVAVTNNSTLDDVREQLLTMPEMPQNYIFVIGGAPVTKIQERTTAAHRCIPLVELRLNDADESAKFVKKPKKSTTQGMVEHEMIPESSETHPENPILKRNNSRFVSSSSNPESSPLKLRLKKKKN